MVPCSPTRPSNFPSAAGRPPSLVRVHLQGGRLNWCSRYKWLGVHLDPRMHGGGRGPGVSTVPDPGAIDGFRFRSPYGVAWGHDRCPSQD